MKDRQDADSVSTESTIIDIPEETIEYIKTMNKEIRAYDLIEIILKNNNDAVNHYTSVYDNSKKPAHMTDDTLSIKELYYSIDKYIIETTNEMEEYVTDLNHGMIIQAIYTKFTNDMDKLYSICDSINEDNAKYKIYYIVVFTLFALCIVFISAIYIV